MDIIGEIIRLTAMSYDKVLLDTPEKVAEANIEYPQPFMWRLGDTLQIVVEPVFSPRNT